MYTFQRLRSVRLVLYIYLSNWIYTNRKFTSIFQYQREAKEMYFCRSIQNTECILRCRALVALVSKTYCNQTGTPGVVPLSHTFLYLRQVVFCHGSRLAFILLLYFYKYILFLGQLETRYCCLCQENCFLFLILKNGHIVFFALTLSKIGYCRNTGTSTEVNSGNF